MNELEVEEQLKELWAEWDREQRKPEPKLREFWICGSQIYKSLRDGLQYHNRHHLIHVREVIDE